MDKWIKLWLKDVGERAAATTLETAAALVAVDQFANIASLSWGHIVGVSATAGVLSVLKGTAARLRGDQDSASLSKDVVVFDASDPDGVPLIER